MTSTARTGSLDVQRQILLQAPAGSGKTTVLAQRFLSALAVVEEPRGGAGHPPSRARPPRRCASVCCLRWRTRCPNHNRTGPAGSGLRHAVLERAAARNWPLAELPQRLRIQTIDSLAAEIARAMPLLGRLQTTLAVVDDAMPLYSRGRA